MGKDTHAEGPGDRCGGGTDASIADQPERQPLEFDERTLPITPVFACGPVPGTGGCGVMTHMLGQLENQGKGHLSDRPRAVVWDIGDRDAPLAGGDAIDNIGAGRKNPQIFEPGQLPEDVAVERRLVCQNTFGVLRAFDHRVRRAALVDPEVPQSVELLPR